MCAINPKHQQHYTISVYTSIPMPEVDFNELVANKILAVENMLNLDMRLRWHVSLDAPAHRD